MAASSFTVSGTVAGYKHVLTVTVTEQDNIANTTTVSYDYELIRNVAKTSGDTLTGTVAFHAIINGVDNVASPTINFKSVTTGSVLSGFQTIDNAENGTLSFTVELKTAGKSGSTYLHAADISGTMFAPSVNRVANFTVGPLPVASGGGFSVSIDSLDSSYTYDVSMTDSLGNLTSLATGATGASPVVVTGTAPTLPSGATADAATITVTTKFTGQILGVSLQDLLIWGAPDAPPIDLYNPFDFRFRNMVRSGSTLAIAEIIPYTTANFTDTYSDTGTCSITTQDALYPGDLDRAVVLAEVFNGSAWVSTGMLFSLTRVTDDAVDIQGSRTYAGTAYVDFILGKGIVTGEYNLAAQTPGYYIFGAIQVSQSRGVAPLLKMDFSPTKTSAGTTWGKIVTQDDSPGTPILQMLQSVVSNEWGEYRVGYDETASKALLQLQNSGFGYDWTLATSGTIVNLKTQGVNRVIPTAPVQKDYSAMLTRVTATGNGSLVQTAARADLIDPRYGVLEARMDAAGIGSNASLVTAANDLISAANEPIVSRQFTYNVDSQDIVPALYPYRVFRPGDWVWVPGDNGVLERDRIQQIIVTKDSSGTTVQITTGDLIPSGGLALYRYYHRATGGAIPGGTLTQTPTPAINATPAPVTNFIATPIGQFVSTGIADSGVSLQWDPVTTDLDGNDSTVVQYTILTRADYTKPWTVATIVPATPPAGS